MKPAGDIAAFVGGFISAEGSFIHSAKRFIMAVGLGAADVSTCVLLKHWFGVGRIHHSARRHAHFDDEVTYRVDRLGDLVGVIVPFMDEHLPASYKRAQYETWRADLLDYWETSAKRRRPCSVDGCEAPRRARGLCRHHYFVVFRR